MRKRGGGRFGKYGDLKRKGKIRQTRVLKRDDKVMASAPRSAAENRTGRLRRAPRAQSAGRLRRD